MSSLQPKAAVVIPSFKVAAHILGVLSRIGPEVQRIFVVDDKCPENTGELVARECRDPRVKVIFHERNLGVGGASLTGFMAALDEGIEIAVKLDGDGQMNPALIPILLEPLLSGEADFAKGNRFFSPHNLSEMPAVRLLGNAAISFIAKLTTGYWNVMDTTNGFLALHTSLLPFLDVAKIERRYFFENDLLFRLGLLRAVVREVPMVAVYGDEVSNLSISRSLFSFPGKFLSRFLKRIFYRYFLRDFNVASLMLVLGSLFTVWGAVFGLYNWYVAESVGNVATSGTVMLAGLPIILGFQMLLYAVLFDITSIPVKVIHGALDRQRDIRRL